MAKAMPSNNSIPATGIQKLDIAQGPLLGFNTERWCLIGHLKLAAVFARIKARKCIRASPPDYQKMFNLSE